MTGDLITLGLPKEAHTHGAEVMRDDESMRSSANQMAQPEMASGLWDGESEGLKDFGRAFLSGEHSGRVWILGKLEGRWNVV